MRDQPRAREEEVTVSSDGVVLAGNLVLPADTQGVVLFAHGSGSGRHSPRNRLVAAELQKRGLGTLLLDLLTPREAEADEVTRELRFDIELLGRRLVGATDWLLQRAGAGRPRIGCFGASTGAAAAIVAAAERPDAVGAVVSRGGRPDLAESALARVKVPTLLIVGSLDGGVIELNEQALARLRAEKKLEIVPGAGHLFEEPGKLEVVARLAGEWFGRHLVS